MRDRNISFSSKWGLRYFELIGTTLSYFTDDREVRPRRSIDISKCVVINEGVKKNRYFVFSLRLENSNLITLSSDNNAEAMQWMQVMETACRLQEDRELSHYSSPTVRAEPAMPSGLDQEELSQLNPLALQRVQSSSRILQMSRSFGSANVMRPVDENAKPPSISKYAPNSRKGKTSMYSDFPASMPIHTEGRPSPLSYDEKQSQQNYRGFFNLGVIIMFLSHARLMLDNIHRHGLQVRLPSLVLDSDATSLLVRCLYSMLQALLFWAFSIAASFTLETIAVKYYIKEGTILMINTALGTFNIVVPIVWVWMSRSHPVVSFVFVFQSVVMWMKLISYAHVNRDLRRCIRHQKGSEDESDYNNAKPQNIYLNNVKNLQLPIVGYPSNITLPNLLFFLIAPTLCYQLNYPRTEKIRWRHAMTLLLRLVVFSAMMYFAFRQYVVPTLNTSIEAVRSNDIPSILEKLLKLSIPNTYIWLLMFYVFFHVWLNLLAELTRFGDRVFYKGGCQLRLQNLLHHYTSL